MANLPPALWLDGAAYIATFGWAYLSDLNRRASVPLLPDPPSSNIPSYSSLSTGTVTTEVSTVTQSNTIIVRLTESILPLCSNTIELDSTTTEISAYSNPTWTAIMTPAAATSTHIPSSSVIDVPASQTPTEAAQSPIGQLIALWSFPLAVADAYFPAWDPECSFWGSFITHRFWFFVLGLVVFYTRAILITFEVDPGEGFWWPLLFLFNWYFCGDRQSTIILFGTYTLWWCLCILGSVGLRGALEKAFDGANPPGRVRPSDPIDLQIIDIDNLPPLPTSRPASPSPSASPSPLASPSPSASPSLLGSPSPPASSSLEPHDISLYPSPRPGSLDSDKPSDINDIDIPASPSGGGIEDLPKVAKEDLNTTIAEADTSSKSSDIGIPASPSEEVDDVDLKGVLDKLDASFAEAKAAVELFEALKARIDAEKDDDTEPPSNDIENPASPSELVSEVGNSPVKENFDPALPTISSGTPTKPSEASPEHDPNSEKDSPQETTQAPSPRSEGSVKNEPTTVDDDVDGTILSTASDPPDEITQASSPKSEGSVKDEPTTVDDDANTTIPSTGNDPTEEITQAPSPKSEESVKNEPTTVDDDIDTTTPSTGNDPPQQTPQAPPSTDHPPLNLNSTEPEFLGHYPFMDDITRPETDVNSEEQWLDRIFGGPSTLLQMAREAGEFDDKAAKDDEYTAEDDGPTAKYNGNPVEDDDRASHSSLDDSSLFGDKD